MKTSASRTARVVVGMAAVLVLALPVPVEAASTWGVSGFLPAEGSTGLSVNVDGPQGGYVIRVSHNAGNCWRLVERSAGMTLTGDGDPRQLIPYHIGGGFDMYGTFVSLSWYDADRPAFMNTWRTQLRAHTTYHLHLAAGIELGCPEGPLSLGAPATLTFTTGADSVPPSILTRDLDPGMDDARLHYETSEPAKVDVTLTSPNGDEHRPGASPLDLQATIGVGGLAPGTTYRVDERVTDQAGNVSTESASLTTKPAPTTTTITEPETTDPTPGDDPPTDDDPPTTVTTAPPSGETTTGDSDPTTTPPTDKSDPNLTAGGDPAESAGVRTEGTESATPDLPEPAPGSAAVQLSAPAVSAGDSLTLDAAGFAADSTVTVTLHSTPRHLGTVAANARGRLHVAVTVPADAEVGAHQLLVEGTGPDGTRLVAAANLDVLPAATRTALARPEPESSPLRTALVAAGLAGILAGALTVRRTARVRQRSLRSGPEEAYELDAVADEEESRSKLR